MRVAGALTITLALVLGSLPGAVAQSGASPSPRPPTEVRGRLSCGYVTVPGTRELFVTPMEGGALVLQERRGDVRRLLVREMSDPRLAGTHTLRLDTDDYYSPLGKPSQPAVGSGLWRIEDEQGAWQGSFTIAWFPDTSRSTVTVPLVGAGAYEGLSAVMEASEDSHCGWNLRGLVIDGALPSTPPSDVAPNDP